MECLRAAPLIRASYRLLVHSVLISYWRELAYIVLTNVVIMFVSSHASFVRSFVTGQSRGSREQLARLQEHGQGEKGQESQDIKRCISTAQAQDGTEIVSGRHHHNYHVHVCVCLCACGRTLSFTVRCNCRHRHIVRRRRFVTSFRATDSSCD